MPRRTTDFGIAADSLTDTTPEPTYAGALSFLRRRYTKSLEGADVAVVGVPLDLATTNRPGARFGPAAVRAASAVMASEQPYGWEFDPRDRLATIDYGDVAFDFGRPDTLVNDIAGQLATIVDAGVLPLVIGGDHFISYPVLQAIYARHGPVSLIHFDAHSDTWEDDPERFFDHGTMFRRAANNGWIEPAHSVQIGLRTFNPDTMGFNILDAPWVHRHGVDATLERTREIVGDRKVYVTFDIDCLDPAFAPGTGTPVSGGLSSAQAIEMLNGLRGINVVGADVVEVAPAYDVGDITALAAAHIGFIYLALFASVGAGDRG
ncbi:MAG: agmatinase [Pseudomonadota bacterium]